MLIGAPGFFPLDLAMRTDSGSVLDSARSRDFTNWHRPKIFSCQNLSVHKILLGAPFSRVYQRALVFSSKNTFHLGVLSGRTTKPETNHPIFSAMQGVWIRSCYSSPHAVAMGGEIVAQERHGGADHGGDEGMRGNGAIMYFSNKTGG